MNTEYDGFHIVADDDLWEFVDEDPIFKEFIGQCISHFVHFVLPIRNQTFEMNETYPIPDRVDISSSSEVNIHRDLDNTLFISFMTW
jgi:hypothetical protein